MHTVQDSAAIGKKIREFRLLAGFTQEQLAEKLGITFQQIQKYEKGTTKVNLTRLQQLAGILNAPMSAFFEESSLSVYQLSDEEIRLLKAFKLIPGPLRVSVMEIVTSLAQKRTI